MWIGHGILGKAEYAAVLYENGKAAILTKKNSRSSGIYVDITHGKIETNYNAERIAGTGNNYGGLVGQGLASSSTVYENIDQWEVDTPVYNDQHWRENKALGDMTFAAWAVIFDMDTGTPVYYFGYMGKEQASSLLK